jgi:hypothetical protein
MSRGRTDPMPGNAAMRRDIKQIKGTGLIEHSLQWPTTAILPQRSGLSWVPSSRGVCWRWTIPQLLALAMNAKDILGRSKASLHKDTVRQESVHGPQNQLHCENDN